MKNNLKLHQLKLLGHPRDWWSDNEDREFRNRSRCFAEQYGNFTVKQLAKMLEDLLGFR